MEGAICVASVACGAPADGSASSKVSFVWTLPTESEYLSRGSCQASVDAACGSGVIIRNTIDEAKTGFNFVEFENAFGYEYLYSASGNTNVKYAALVFDGPQTTANGCLLYTSPSPRDLYRSRMPSSA